MAEKRYFWMRLKDDFFTSKRIKKLRKLGADYLIIYLKMQLKAIKTNGILEMTGIENSIAEEIALDIDEDSDKVQITLSYLQACGLLEVKNNELILPYAKENIGSETANAQRVRDYRERQKLLQCNADVTEVKQPCNVEIDIEKDIDNDISKDILSSAIDYLNEKCGTKFKASTKNTKKHVSARVSEGYTLDDFKKVIDNKVAEWGDNPTMCQYLRPDTLFGTKFESYLNQKTVTTPPKPGIEINQKQREGMIDIVDWGM